MAGPKIRERSPLPQRNQPSSKKAGNAARDWTLFVCEACGTEALVGDPKAQLFCWPCAFSFFAVEEPQP
jgi:hypothetical protein